MSDSGLDKFNARGQQEAQADIDREARRWWYAAMQRFTKDPRFHILDADHKSVAACATERDRDFLLRAARAHDHLVAALISARAELQRDRDSFFECHSVAGQADTLDDEDRGTLKEMDDRLLAIDNALYVATVPA